jgi:hypothetical protein
MEIVQNYSDRGRSGLNIAGREGLNQLRAGGRLSSVAAEFDNEDLAQGENIHVCDLRRLRELWGP